MGIPWVLPSFKHILVDASAEFLRTTDKKKGKQRTAFIDRVTEEIRQAVADTNDPLPIDLTKVCLSLLYSGCAGTDYVSLSVHGSETRPTDTQREAGRKHPRRIHVVTPSSSRNGTQKRFAEAFMQIESPRFKSACLAELKNSSVCMLQP
jgi:hypothetical protein